MDGRGPTWILAASRRLYARGFQTPEALDAAAILLLPPGHFAAAVFGRLFGVFAAADFASCC